MSKQKACLYVCGYVVTFIEIFLDFDLKKLTLLPYFFHNSLTFIYTGNISMSVPAPCLSLSMNTKFDLLGHVYDFIACMAVGQFEAIFDPIFIRGSMGYASLKPNDPFCNLYVVCNMEDTFMSWFAFAYDKGFLSADRVMAGNPFLSSIQFLQLLISSNSCARWRRFLQHRQPRTQAELLKQVLALELLVAYTRFRTASQPLQMGCPGFKVQMGGVDPTPSSLIPDQARPEWTN